MKYDKVVYFRYMPLTVKIVCDFYMLEVEKLGLKVEYWDITKLFFNDTASMEDSSGIIKTVKFDTIEQFEKAVELEANFSKTLFISIISFEARVKNVFKIFTKYNSTTAVFGRNMFPLPQGKSVSLLSRLKHLNVLNYAKNLIARKQKRIGSLKGYDIIFIGGELGWKGIGNIEYDEVSKAELVKINSDDYDTYLRHVDDLSIIEGEYILFLDEYLPLHPDTVLFDIKNIKPEHYYPELCAFFNRVEQQFNMPIIIAAHPKALQYKKQDYFEGRKVIFDKTAVLSKFANFVLAHDTTSINYPITFGTKLHFISSDAIEKEINSVHQNAIHFAKFLGSNFQRFNIVDEHINVISEVSKEKYDQYKYNFQTWPETENKQSRDIFIDFLKK